MLLWLKIILVKMMMVVVYGDDDGDDGDDDDDGDDGDDDIHLHHISGLHAAVAKDDGIWSSCHGESKGVGTHNA